MLETMTKLQTVYLSSGSQGTITFTNIPQNYTDLVVKASVRSTYASTYYDNMLLTFNGSSSGYSFARGIGIGNGISIDGPFVSQSNIYVGEVPAVTATASTFSNNDMYLPNYTGSTFKHISVDKTLENTTSTYIIGMAVGLWANTSPITSINLALASGSFAQYSQVTLYGVKAQRTAVGNSVKATGGAISFDGTYVYHTFTSTGAFAPTTRVVADILSVSGGGGGGAAHGGGGGAGGLYYSPNTPLQITSYTLTVGGGGAGSTTSASGTNGVNSSFTGLTDAVGGGGGGTYSGTGTSAGSNGGSGGGGSNYPGNTVYSGGTATSGQGNAGGSSSGNLAGGAGGGGGGSGAAGSNGTNQGTLSQGGGQGGTGGDGLNAYSTWLSATGLGVSGYIAGGGGGGSYRSPSYTTYVASAGGAGGGGAGGYSNSAYTPQAAGVGVINTGSGGGGGAGNGGSGSAGGSGLIIVRYKA
jgi:hypothetical protein